MKSIAVSLASLVALLTPTLALACPGYGGRGAGACGASSTGEYMAAIGVGLLVGLGSVALEGALKKK